MSNKDDYCVMSDPQFLVHLGLFHIAWSAAELSIDCAMGDLLRLTDEETHILTAGMELARKATMLRLLLKRSALSGKNEAIKALNAIQNESKRNIFAHSYLSGNKTTVSFLRREAGNGDFKYSKHRYTVTEFQQHVRKLVDHGYTFSTALGISPERQAAFINAAEIMNASKNTTP